KTKLLFEEAQQKVQSFGLRSSTEYQVWQKDHPDMPGNPEDFYRDKGWTNWDDFLGKTKLLFKEAQQKVQSFGLRSSTEYQVWQKDHPDMPGKPQEFFRDKGWTNWYDFLGKVKLLFEEAQQKVQPFGLRSSREYLVWQKDHPDMSSTPHRFFRGKGWTNWDDFLGKTKPTTKLLFKEAQQKVQSFGLRSRAEYQVWQKDHPDMPGKPQDFYRDKGWTNWDGFLGKTGNF
ncbi:MAG: hypothetical protein OXB86_02065, partial [Bdellovibrionales bacterium]|nr:hypothetical protein [Bdellovibrionales bacterium]